jgi:hypothetical protein
MYLHLFHVFFVGSLFMYVGVQRTAIPAFLDYVLLGLGIILFFYQAYKAYMKVVDGKNPWVNLIHVLLVAPLLIYIGFKGEDTPRPAFELLLLLGFAAIGYHGYYLFV